MRISVDVRITVRCPRCHSREMFYLTSVVEHHGFIELHLQHTHRFKANVLCPKEIVLRGVIA